MGYDRNSYFFIDWGSLKIYYINERVLNHKEDHSEETAKGLLGKKYLHENCLSYEQNVKK